MLAAAVPRTGRTCLGCLLVRQKVVCRRVTWPSDATNIDFKDHRVIEIIF